MLDFLSIASRNAKSGGVEIYPKFMICRTTDLMIRGGDFYAIWVEERGLWSTDEQDALQLIDQELSDYAEKYREQFKIDVKVLYMRDSENCMIDRWHKYCQKHMRDSFHMLDEKLIFSNTETNKKDYASKKLSYPLEAGDTKAWDKLVSTLYSEEERRKIEWAIGSIVSGDSKKIQKFMVLYGAAGTGKSTILNIIQQLFEGYYSVFDAKALGSSSNAFALESFKTNPLVAIQHDGDLSKIEDNTRLNSLVSHELMTINEKFKSQYSNRFKCFLFMGTNKPVKITDAKSGLIRRLIDVSPSGNKLNQTEYKQVMRQIGFELGAIASHCLNVYLEDPSRYDDYMPVTMMGASNDFYNFVIDAYHIFLRDDSTTLKAAWEMYKTYCDEAKVPYPLSQRSFKEELKNYFREYTDRLSMDDGSRVRSYYSGFRTEKFDTGPKEKKEEETPKPQLIQFNSTESILDKELADCPAQYATEKETPYKKWESVTTTLSDLDTSKLHYVRIPENHIVIDFDIPDENGDKNFEKNLEEASKWPATYAELSKSGKGIHLHYIYTGDVSKLSRVYDNHIEVKVFNGNSSLRRRLTKCNTLPIASISSGLQLKGEDKLVNFEGIKNEKMLRTLIKRNLNKEYHSSTKCSIDFIYKNLEDAYASGIGYDVTDLQNQVYAFAANSTNQSAYCMRLVDKMHFKSEDPSDYVEIEGESPIVFYDIEVFPNLFLVEWKVAGEGKPVVKMINPKPKEIESLLKYRLVGFNNRRYDNHILYAALMGYTNEELFNLSQKIINAPKGEQNKYLFGEAFNLSYTDIYDFASAGNKMSLKKLEIKMGIHHQELGLPWDKPVPEEKWIDVADYCQNDVIATEAAFYYLSADWTARQILADLAEGSVNDTTNTLTGKIIFGKNRKPQSEFNYRDLSKPVYDLDEETLEFLREAKPEMMAQRHGEAKSLLPYFPGYEFKAGKSTYRDKEAGEGGYVSYVAGIWLDVALLDVQSMHPNSAISEVLFGVRFTRRFKEIVDGRVSIKHEAWEEVNKMLDGKLTKYIQKVIDGEMTSKDLANALKTAINAVYGQTAASYPNAFRDNRNVDNIVAKRGALFMIELEYQVQKRGFTACHIKTDSIKIANATPEIIDFVMDFGKRYGYVFEHEETYDRMCLVNGSTYIAKYKEPHIDKKTGKEIWWTATAKQFQVPYVFKTLFSKEPIEFSDFCETYEVKSALYLDMNEGLPEGEHDMHFIGKVGQFCPIKPGCGGGDLLREAKDDDGNVKYDAATGSKGYRWLESEVVKELGKEGDIDRSYYDRLVDEAIYGSGTGKNRKPGIDDFGDFEWFVSDDPYMTPLCITDQPPWVLPCGDVKRQSCVGCPHFHNDPFDMDCDLGHDISNIISNITEKGE